MTITKAKATIAELLADFPDLEAALDAAPLQTSVQEKLIKCQEFARKALPKARRIKVDAACRQINHNLQIGSYN